MCLVSFKIFCRAVAHFVCAACVVPKDGHTRTHTPTYRARGKGKQQKKKKLTTTNNHTALLPLPHCPPTGCVYGTLQLGGRLYCGLPVPFSATATLPLNVPCIVGPLGRQSGWFGPWPGGKRGGSKPLFTRFEPLFPWCCPTKKLKAPSSGLRARECTRKESAWDGWPFRPVGAYPTQQQPRHLARRKGALAPRPSWPGGAAPTPPRTLLPFHPTRVFGDACVWWLMHSASAPPLPLHLHSPFAPPTPPPHSVHATTDEAPFHRLA